MTSFDLYFPDDKTTESYGRNGRYKTIGVYVWLNAFENEIVIEGITSRGLPAKGRLNIPRNSAAKLAKVLNKVAKGEESHDLP